ncbi:hypothetical protein K0504_06890 [Neiella marina]|uniref:Rhamnan synthesis protein F n=1 Tax=Neiella holothuriorum TaxID=2870530 RepID=A0ABS7EER9_9GAMM|nr:rhamnan synthesis F family protein [Neiella holothuriorum]MBW8190755.1 hypothetical protein [Neiella holothuriorum]
MNSEEVLAILFDEHWYSNSYPDVKSSDMDPFYHYCNFGWKEGRNPSVYFDNDIFISLYNNTEFLNQKQTNPLSYFCDVIFHDYSYKELIKLPYIASSASRELFHEDGQKKIFDEEWYLKKYPDVKNYEASPFLHYINVGWKELRDPSALFNTLAYLRSEPFLEQKLDELGIDPIQHYLQSGHKENRAIFDVGIEDVYQRYMPTSSPRHIEDNGSCNRGFTDKTKYVAIVHCYYPDIAYKLIDPCIKLGIDVIVTVTEGGHYIHHLERYGDNITIEEYPNRGRDMLPFIRSLQKRINDYDFCLHLHTKKSLHYGEERSDWLDYCLESLLSSSDFVQRAFDNENVSIVYPEAPDFLKDIMNWGGNKKRVIGLLDMLGIDFDNRLPLDFPAGSMFWFRIADLAPIFNLNISDYLFEPEFGQVDGTLSHALERLFGVYVGHIDKELVPIRKKDTKIFSFDKGYYDFERYLPDHITKSSSDYNLALENFYPELAPLTFQSADSTKYRINLLVPTVNEEAVFGGISTALKFLMSLWKQSCFDIRIICTDQAARSTSATKYKNFSNYNLSYFSDDDPRQILSVSERHNGDLSIRANDIFVATAWWTANHLREIEKFQIDNFEFSPKHIYLIQDYEPHFYAWSSKSQLADLTYENDWIKVYNTIALYDYFKFRGKSSGQSYILKPRLNDNILSEVNKKIGVPKEKLILIYGRPSAERNCFELILEAIRIWRQDDVSIGWTVISLGEDISSQLVESYDVDVKGKVTLSEYADYLAKSYVGISLMASPHPSYPPLEMSSSQVYTYTNVYDNKGASYYDSPYLTFGSLEPMAIANFLKDNCLTYNENIKLDTINSIFDQGQGDSLDDVTNKIIGLQNIIDEGTINV